MESLADVKVDRKLVFSVVSAVALTDRVQLGMSVSVTRDRPVDRLECKSVGYF